MVISRKWAVFLTGVGVWTWVIWPRFALAILDDDRAFRNGTPTAFLWVHAVLIVASLAIGTTVGVLGVRVWRSSARGGPAKSEESPPVRLIQPQD
jgi:ABC-type Mn2+/Zn2+ transport system permease subunit